MPSAALRPLRSRNFALLWSASLVSNIGTWLQTVAVGAYVTELTGQFRWTGLVAAAGFLPVGLLGPVGGALADRVDRRKALIAANLAEAGLASLLAVLVATGGASAAVVTLVVFAAGCVSSMLFPMQQALVPDLVPREDLLAATSLGSTQFNLGRVLGPALAAVVIASASFAWAFALNAASFFAVIAALVVLRVPARTSVPDETPLVPRIRAGVRVARDEPGCRAAIGLIALVAVGASPFIALVPATASNLTDGGGEAVARVAGILTTAQGIGAVAGALALAGLAARFGRRRVLVTSLVACPLALVPYAAAPSVPLAAVAMAVVGATYICVLSGMSTVVQLRAPAAYRGRVLSLYFVALGALYPLAALVQGVLADVVGLRQVTIGGAVLLLAALAALAVGRPGVLAALDDPPTADAPPPVVGVEDASIPVDAPSMSPAPGR